MNEKWGGGGGGFFFNDTATTEIYTLSLHDALPILHSPVTSAAMARSGSAFGPSMSFRVPSSRSLTPEHTTNGLHGRLTAPQSRSHQEVDMALQTPTTFGLRICLFHLLTLVAMQWSRMMRGAKLYRRFRLTAHRSHFGRTRAPEARVCTSG